MNSPSNSFQSIFRFCSAYEQGRDAETGQCTCDEVHSFLSTFSLQLISLLMEIKSADAYNHVQTRIPSAEMSHFLSSPYLCFCVVYEFTFTQCITSHPTDRRLREDLWVCAKDQEKCFLINYSGSHNPFWAERGITLRDALHVHSVSFPLPTCLTPSFPSSLNHSFSVPFFPLCVFARSHFLILQC